jgi:hypothetical protein
MIFIPFHKELSGRIKSLLSNKLVPFIFKGNECAKEPLFLVANCGFWSSEARGHGLVMVGVGSSSRVSCFLKELSVSLEDDGNGEGVWDRSVGLLVSPILVSQSETFISARLFRHRRGVVQSALPWF